MASARGVSSSLSLTALISKPAVLIALRGTWVVSPIRRLKMKQILGLGLALSLFAGGMWASVSGARGPLSQDKGAWVSHADR